MDGFRAMLFGNKPATAEQSGKQDPNVAFYKGEIASQPHGDFVDAIHEKWDGDFQRLEMHHGYIQWLFPVFENAGMNFESAPLSKEGAAIIRADATCCQRVLKSYRLMLKFYGLRLEDEKTGVVGRHESCYEAQMDNFNYSGHNFLRISRIITSLGELGFQRYKKPLIERLKTEVECGALANGRDSCYRFWEPLVTGETEEWYARKTREEPADRAENVLFQPGGPLHEGAAGGEGGGPGAAE